MPGTVECPKCGGDVQAVGEDLRCAACGSVGIVTDGLLCFTDPSYYWGEISRSEMQRVNKLAFDRGWRTAVEEVVADAALRQYITDPKRADFQYLWDLPADARVLDLGAGWGAITASLAQNFPSVLAVEGVWERARFIRTRLRQMGLLAPADVICADFLQLPLARNQFDAVVLNGVLEWVGTASTAANPRDLQLQVLRKVHAVLKPSGFACVGIENRIGWAVLRGGLDHSGLRYTSLMPRPIADLWCRWYGREYRSDHNRGYRTYTYSLRGYKKLFRRAGFSKVRAFHAWNGYNKPSVLLPLENRSALLHFANTLDSGQTGWRNRLKLRVLRWGARTGLWANGASEFIFQVEKR